MERVKNDKAAKGAGSVRRGTATTDSGKATVARILAVARELLTAESSREFSMRNIAARAGLRLANVQYYFPRREDLVHALIVDTGRQYQRAYDELIGKLPSDPVEHYKAMLRFNMHDIFSPATRNLFIQLWALFDKLDGHSGRLLGQLYAINVSQLGKCLARIHPGRSAADIKRRATLVAALTEGLMIVRGPQTFRVAASRELLDHAFSVAMEISLIKEGRGRTPRG
jgi:AcrR family transcriptional regulator